MPGHYIICGLGRVGLRVAEVFSRLGETVTIVTLNVQADRLEDAMQLGARVIDGDARMEAVLADAGLANASGLIVTTENDLMNIEIALDVRRLRPEIPLVIRLFDQTLADQIETAFDIRGALAMSVLAAPVFAAAALGEHTVASFKLDSRLLLVGPSLDESLVHGGFAARLSSDSDSLSAVESDLYLADVSEWDHELGGKKTAFKGRYRTEWGEIVHFLLNPKRWWQSLSRLWRAIPLSLRAVFAGLNAVMAISIFVFHFAMHLSFVDAIYFMIATVTTTGYGDISFSGHGAALKLYACLVMMLGSALLATLYSIVTDYVVTARFLQLMGKNKIPKSGHVIVAGLGTVGFRIVEKLQLAGVEVVAIDRDADNAFVSALHSQTPVVIGDVRMPETLAKAGSSGARALIAVSDDDAANIGATLEIRKLNPKARTVVRLYDAQFAAKVKDALNIDVVLGSYTIGAPTFAATAMYPNVMTAFLWCERLYVIFARSIGQDSSGKSVREWETAEKQRVLLLRKSGATQLKASQPDTLLTSGDQLLTMITRPLM